MNKLYRALTCGTLLLSIVGLTACQQTRETDAGAASGENQAANTSTAIRDSRNTLSGSRVKIYNSLGELAKDSTVVAVVTILNEVAIEKVETIPFTVTTVRVEESLRGSEAGAELKIRQTGDDSVRLGEEFLPLLRADEKYLLFLEDFKFEPETKTGQFVITGNAGGFRYNQDGKAERVDPISESLPKQITVADARMALVDRD